MSEQDSEEARLTAVLKDAGIQVEGTPSFGAAAQLRMLGLDDQAEKEWEAALERFQRESPDKPLPRKPWSGASF